DPMDLTAAHRTLPFDTRLKVTHDGKSVIVRINDRGPYSGTRVLDLSEAAFAKLAPIERGVIEVEMEQFSGAKEALPTLPEFVRDVVSPVIKNPTLPEEVAEKVQETRGEQTPEPSLRQPLFDETVAHLSEDFFERIELRHPVPQKVIAGTVLNISGTIDAYGHETVTVFLDAGGGETREQLHFSDELSGKNFVVPVQFLEPGTYRLGIVIDDNRRSRVGEIEVVRPTRERRFPSSDHDFSQAKFQTRVIPEKQKVALDFFLLKPGNLVKVIFAQGNRREALLIEGGLQTIELPYEFFQQFSDGGPFEVEVYFADSETGKLADRRTNWQLFESRTYQLVPGFRDTESEKISVQNFPRYPKSLEEFLLSGKVLEKDVTLKDTVFWHTPTGNIRKIPLVKGPTPDQFSFRLIPEGWGTHVLEIVSDEGEILFNRALYFAETYVLPVQAWQYESLNGNNSVALRDWVNRLRRNRGVSILTTDTKLQAVAQQYAEQMAAEDFVSHTSPTGLTFQDRIENAHLQGDFAENLSFGSTLEVALQGLEESASHFQHIIGRKWNSIGIGLAQNDKGWYVVQVFGR
ncbi:MAG: hypothetical protein K9M51_04085, partial [Candidatus Gracilibacteria bacterium]|nr:hypothetical protein [Candidatus Gracilibacteria bacterium]